MAWIRRWTSIETWSSIWRSGICGPRHTPCCSSTTRLIGFSRCFSFCSSSSVAWSQRLHGCMILDYLQKNSLHGNNNICDAVQTIQRSVYTVFIKQLYQWLIYGKPVDPHGEFFIQQIDETASKAATGPSSIQNTYSAPSETTSVNTELWRYEVSLVMLPYYFPSTWADNVLLSGQTVLAFNSYPTRDIHRRLESLDEPDEPPVSLWGDQ